MAVPKSDSFRLFIGDEEVASGGAEPVTPRQLDRRIEIAFTFRPNWVGLWKVMALSADSPPK
jgi:hypothetical protein